MAAVPRRPESGPLPKFHPFDGERQGGVGEGRAMSETRDFPPAAFNRLFADFSRLFTDLADQHRTAMCGISERATFQYLENIIASAEVAIGVWPDASGPNGVGLHMIKGLRRVMTAMETSGPARVSVDAVPYAGRKQAVAAGQKFGDNSN
jgi:hypothetical protein